MSLDYRDLQKLFRYDESSPSCLVWNMNIFSGKSYSILTRAEGDFVGNLNQNGGWSTAVKRKHINIARAVYMVFYSLNLSKDDFIDHIDGDRSNNKISNLRVVDIKLNNRNKAVQRRSKTGVTGVSIINMTGNKLYARAKWRDLNGKDVVKYFSIDDYGLENALALAKDYRDYGINILNSQGAGYTDRHSSGELKC